MNLNLYSTQADKYHAKFDLMDVENMRSAKF